ncbi:MAG: hypothetical protein ACHQAX_07130 [Gammaproteobacteria bacterium]
MPNIDVKRSGFLSQIVSGKPTYASRAPRLFEDFGMTVLALSDTSVDSHRVLTALESEKTENGKLEIGTASHILKIHQEKEGVKDKNKNVIKTTIRTGVGPFKTYYGYSVQSPDKNTNFYKIFFLLRKLLFRLFKSLDSIIRLPAIIFSSPELLLERGGWNVQTLYKTTDNVLLKGAAFVFIAPIGLILNVIGAIVFKALVLVSKIAAEAVRMPLAIMGAGVGVVFGGIVAICQNLMDTGSGAPLKSAPNSVFQGMLDGIRPFAPEFANNLQRAWVQSEAARMSIRWPFQKLSGDTNQKTGPIDPPWFSIAMFTTAVIAVVLLSTTTFGINALNGTTLLQLAFDASGIAAGGIGPFGLFTFMKLNPELSMLTLVTIGLMGIGGLSAAFVSIGRGIKAFFNDVAEMGKPREEDVLIPKQQQHVHVHVRVQPKPEGNFGTTAAIDIPINKNVSDKDTIASPSLSSRSH